MTIEIIGTLQGLAAGLAIAGPLCAAWVRWA